MSTPAPAYDLRALSARFQMPGDFRGGTPYGSGHINDTFAVVFDQAGAPVRYILQRINHNIFKDPVSLMRNVERVTEHQRRKLAAAGAPDVARRALTLVPLRGGGTLLKDDDGNHWRAYLFIEKAQTYDRIESTTQAYEAAKAFGQFAKELSDLPAPRLAETIPGFHDTRMRFDTLKKAIEADAHNRAKDVKGDIEFALARESIVDTLLRLNREGKIPERITHNDTKLNNVMLDDATGTGVCVIDLDTAMPGLALYDFGDMARTATRPTAEDERDLSKIDMLMPMFEALVRGYMESFGAAMAPAEKDHLAFSARLITFEIGIRFLTDYLHGDIYFKTHRPGHNVDRCRVQFTMCESFERHEAEMTRLVAANG